MTIQPIRSATDHEHALKRIEALMSAQKDTAEGDELDVLATLVDAYEKEHFPIDAPDPVEAIKFRMEQLGLSRKDLEPLLGSRARVSEVMNKRRLPNSGSRESDLVCAVRQIRRSAFQRWPEYVV